MKLKLGIKVGVMLSTLVLGLVCFVGCNSEEATAAVDPVEHCEAGRYGEAHDPGAQA